MKPLTEQQYWNRFSRLSSAEKILIFQEALNVDEHTARNYYSQFLQNLERKQLLSQLLRRKQPASALETIKRLETAAAQLRVRKETPLQMKFKFHIFEIAQLKAAGFGWKKLSQYLEKEYNLKIKYTALKYLFEKYEYLTK